MIAPVIQLPCQSRPERGEAPREFSCPSCLRLLRVRVYTPGMDFESITSKQAEAVCVRLQPMLNYAVQLHKRMVARKFSDDDELLLAASRLVLVNWVLPGTRD